MHIPLVYEHLFYKYFVRRSVGQATKGKRASLLWMLSSLFSLQNINIIQWISIWRDIYCRVINLYTSKQEPVCDLCWIKIAYWLYLIYTRKPRFAPEHKVWGSRNLFFKFSVHLREREPFFNLTFYQGFNQILYHFI